MQSTPVFVGAGVAVPVRNRAFYFSIVREKYFDCKAGGLCSFGKTVTLPLKNPNLDLSGFFGVGANPAAG
jgi:hypothetical protein